MMQPDVEPRPEGEVSEEESGAEGDGETQAQCTSPSQRNDDNKDLEAANMALTLEVERLRKNLRRHSVRADGLDGRRATMISQKRHTLSALPEDAGGSASVHTVHNVLQENARLREQVAALERQRDGLEFKLRQCSERALSAAGGEQAPGSGDGDHHVEAALEAVEHGPKSLRNFVQTLMHRAQKERVQTAKESEQTQKWLRLQIDASHQRLHQSRKEIQELQRQLAEKDSLNEAHTLLHYERDRAQSLQEELEHVTQELQIIKLNPESMRSERSRFSLLGGRVTQGLVDLAEEQKHGEDSSGGETQAEVDTDDSENDDPSLGATKLAERCTKLRAELNFVRDSERMADSETQRLANAMLLSTQKINKLEEESAELHDACVNAESSEEQARESEQNLLRDLVDASNKLVSMEHSRDELQEELAAAREAGRKASTTGFAMTVKCARLQETARKSEMLEQQCRELESTLEAAADREAEVRRALRETAEVASTAEQAVEAARDAGRQDEAAKAEALRRDCDELRSEISATGAGAGEALRRDFAELRSELSAAEAGAQKAEEETVLREALEQRLVASEQSEYEACEQLRAQLTASLRNEQEELAVASSLRDEVEKMREAQKAAEEVQEVTERQRSERIAGLAREVEDRRRECGQLRAQLAASKRAEQEASLASLAMQTQLESARGGKQALQSASKEAEILRQETEFLRAQVAACEVSEQKAKKTCDELIDTAQKVDDLQLECDGLRSELAASRPSASPASNRSNRPSSGVGRRARSSERCSRSEDRSPHSSSTPSPRKPSLPTLREEGCRSSRHSVASADSSLAFSDVTAPTSEDCERNEAAPVVSSVPSVFSGLSSVDDSRSPPPVRRHSGTSLCAGDGRRTSEPGSLTKIWSGVSLVSKIEQLQRGSSIPRSGGETLLAPEKPSWWMASPRGMAPEKPSWWMASPRGMARDPPKERRSLRRSASVGCRPGVAGEPPRRSSVAVMGGGGEALDSPSAALPPERGVSEDPRRTARRSVCGEAPSPTASPARGRSLGAENGGGAPRGGGGRGAGAAAPEEVPEAEGLPMEEKTQGSAEAQEEQAAEAEAEAAEALDQPGPLVSKLTLMRITQHEADDWDRRESTAMSSYWCPSAPASSPAASGAGSIVGDDASSAAGSEDARDPQDDFEHPLAHKLRRLREEGAKVRCSLRNRDSHRMNKLRAAVAVAATNARVHLHHAVEAASKSTAEPGEGAQAAEEPTAPLPTPRPSNRLAVPLARPPRPGSPSASPVSTPRGSTLAA